MPEKDSVDTLILPLTAMLELAYMESEALQDESWMDEILRYIKQNHTQNITIEQICERFSCSRSKISHTFKSVRYSELSVTEIAYSVGFCDSNYFSNVFKKQYGISPKDYRKNGTHR